MSEYGIPAPQSIRWSRFLMALDMGEGGPRSDRSASQAQWQLMAFHKGGIVKRVGNTLLMEFADARACLEAAFALGPQSGTACG